MPADACGVLLFFDDLAQAEPTQVVTATWDFMLMDVDAAVAVLRERKPVMVRADDLPAVLESLALALCH